MIYCMSDIHGESDRYQAMLKLINFSDEDTLYIIGDVADRQPNGISIYLDIMARSNVILIRGNHEQLLLDAIESPDDPGAREIWERNGGRVTRRDLLYMRTPEVRERILHYIRSTPDHLDIEVNGRSFHLVHGFPGEDRDSRTWERPYPDTPAPFPDRTTIVGHTPTILLAGDNGHPLRIWHGDGVICIDCGCGHRSTLVRLACLRLDDMSEFYV